MEITEKDSISLGYILAIMATALWAGNFIIARALHTSIPPISLAFWRWGIAVIVIIPLVSHRLAAKWNLIRQHLIYFSITALLGITAFNTLIYIAGETTYAINLSVINTASPAFIILLAGIFYKERITLYKLFGLIISITGILLLITNGNLTKILDINFAIGDIWALLAAILFAIYSILIKKKPNGIDSEVFLAVIIILGWIFLIPLYLWNYNTYGFTSINLPLIYNLLYLGIFASVAAYFMWNKAIDIIGASKVGIIYYLIPIFSSIGANIILNEVITLTHIISLGLIISGIIIANRF